MKKTLTGAITLVVLIAMLAATASAAGFSDTQGHWASDYIDSAVALGYFSGNPDGSFAPDGSITRAMMVMVLSNAAGAELDNTKSSFNDVPANEWYTGAVTWAAENGITTGTGDGNFMPNEPVSREQMCAFIIRFMENVKGFDLSEYSSDISQFTDKDSISEYAQKYVGLCVALGLINGIESETGLCFAPSSGATRAQVAVVTVKYSSVAESLTLGETGTTGETTAPSGSGNGGGTGTVPPDDEHTEEEIAEEARIVSYLENIISDLSTMSYLADSNDTVKGCAKILTDCIEQALDDHYNGQFITKAYIKSTYGSEVQNFKSTYESLSDEDNGRLSNIMLRLDQDELDAVMDYFGVHL